MDALAPAVALCAAPPTAADAPWHCGQRATWVVSLARYVCLSCDTKL